MDQIPQDLSQVPQPTEDNLTATLANRFQHGQFYTRIASSVLIQLNPFHSGKVELSENILQDQVLTYKDGARLVAGSGHNQRMPPPHAIELATSAYLHMRRTGQDQSIITRYSGTRQRLFHFQPPPPPTPFFYELGLFFLAPHVSCGCGAGCQCWLFDVGGVCVWSRRI